VNLAEALEAAASALPAHADAIRPANGDPERLLAALDAAAASEILRWLLDARPDEGAELAIAWADSEAGAAPIRAVDEAALGKAGRKALRRAQHRLRSRGVAIDAPAPAPHVATLPRLEDELHAALLSPPDPSGAQLAVLVEPAPSGGARVFQGVLDLERGVLELRVIQVNRSQARGLLREVGADAQLAATPAPRDAIAALFARAAAVQPPDRALPAAFTEWRARLARPPEGTATPGELARAALGGGEPLASLLREVAEAVVAGTYGPWPPDFDVLRGLAEKVRDTAQSQLLVNDQQRRAQVDAVLADAAETRFGGAAGERNAARFEEVAWAAWKRGREDEARRCLAAARAFREQPARDNPVARALLERALRPLLEALREEQAASLLVKP
jgi:hypothetical protein